MLIVGITRLSIFFVCELRLDLQSCWKKKESSYPEAYIRTLGAWISCLKTCSQEEGTAFEVTFDRSMIAMDFNLDLLLLYGMCNQE